MLKKMWIILLLAFVACGQNQNNTFVVKTGSEIFEKATIQKTMKDVFRFQVNHTNPEFNDGKSSLMGWVPSAFYTGVIGAYHTTNDEEYLNEAIRWGNQCEWKPGPRLRHADDHTCGQIYLEVYEIKNDPKMLAPIQQQFDSIMTDPKPGRVDWWWCDALYMAPPTLARLAKVTGKVKYRDFMNDMFWDATDFLFDKDENLYYRDENYFNQKTKNGRKIFWSRGNGWVMGGTVRVLEYLPADDSMRDKYVHLHQKMAAAISKAQGEDGMWRTSLLDAEEFPSPESSGTGFYCYSIAWGINNGYLGAETYVPVVKKAWRGLMSAVNENGKLGWVQQIGADPRATKADDTQAYAAGAFLLAGGEVMKLVDKGLIK